MTDIGVTANRTPERLAYWYFRLNGFLSIENFVVHPEWGRNTRTDVDLLTARFLHRSENADTPMQDDPQVSECLTFANVILAEVKRGRCALNGPWTSPNSANMQRVVRAIGCVEQKEINEASAQLYESGRWANDLVTIRLFSLGEWCDTALPVTPDQQITWESVIDFCIARFRAYERQKSSVVQWTHDGIRLKELALAGDVHAIRNHFGLRQEPT